MKRTRPDHRMTQRGAVLMELVVSIAIFVGAGMLTLSIVQRSYDSLQRTHDEQLVIDLAKSKLAELEAGLISIGDLQQDTIDTVGSIDLLEALEASGSPDAWREWRMEVESNPSAFRGLTLVEITVLLGEAQPSDPADAAERRPTVTLRQLVRLREARVEEYQQDELLEGLPEGGGSR